MQANSSRSQFDTLLKEYGSERATDIGNDMKSVMIDHVSVFRTEAGMQEALEKVRELKERLKHVQVGDRGKIFNTDLLTPGSWATCSTWLR